MLLFSPISSPRLEYMATFIARELGVSECRMTSSKEEYLSFEGIRVNYSNSSIEGDVFHLQPHSLLFERGLKEQRIQCFVAEGMKAFFKTGGDYPFDIFAASFYLLSRYEEYLPHKKDMYGRYAHDQSLAYREGFLQQPLVNVWFRHFRNELKKFFPGAVFQENVFSFLPTYDIDEAFAFKHKSPVRTWGGKLRAWLKRDHKENQLRNAVLSGKVQDPYDAFDFMDELNRTAKLFPLYFFLVPDRTGKYDRNISPRTAAMQELLKRHAAKYRIGIHPSWRSGNEEALVDKERLELEKITGKKVFASRQHFIRFTLPATYRQLEKSGITEEYSMGYGSINGFRASVCSPYYWYDLGKERFSTMMIYPFCFMEANSFFEQKNTPEQALEELEHYQEVIKEVNGQMITIWHNTFLGTAPRFKGWREVYESFCINTERNEEHGV